MLLGTLLVTGTDGRWHFGVGDPTLLGWLTCLLYFVTAFACFRALLSARFGAQKLAQVSPAEAKNQRVLALLWLGMCLIMLVLGANKQLDLQTLFTEVARDLAKRQGWYEGRRVVQVAFLAGLTLLGGVLGLGLSFALRKVLRRILLVLAGLGLIAFYVIVRAAMFNHLAPADGQGALTPIWLFELTGIALITFSAQRATVPWERASA